MKESGVGGIFEVVPMERDGEGGSVGRRDKMCDVDGEAALGTTY